MSRHFQRTARSTRFWVFLGKGGKGIFAARRFERGELLCVWGGEVMTGDQLHRLTPEEQLYTLQIETISTSSRRSIVSATPTL
jgi:hypothetical protein